MIEEKLGEVENQRWEYREVAAGHRFYVGLRFIIAAFTATLQSALLKFYNDLMQGTVLQLPVEVTLFGIQLSLEAHPISITFVGIGSMIAIFVMEMRNIGRIGIMIDRGKELEGVLSLCGFTCFCSISSPFTKGVKRERSQLREPARKDTQE